MKKNSAGILLYRFNKQGLPEIFLGHMGGPFWTKKDVGAWSIPKGEFDETEDVLAAAKREFEEETGAKLAGEFRPLLPIKQKSGKVVYAWALEGDLDASGIKSNLFEIEWPPRSGRIQQFPEIDRAAWFDTDTAKEKLVAGQKGLIDQLLSFCPGFDPGS